MSPAKDVDRQVARLARVTDEELRGFARSGPARDLMDGIVAGRFDPAPEPGPARRRVRRFALATALAGALSVAIVLAPIVLPNGAGTAASYANEAIEIRREGDGFVARIKDPLADSARYEQGFRAVGRDVEIELVPVPPDLVGMVLETSGDGSLQVSSRQDCAVPAQPCTVEIRVSADGDGSVRQVIGRAARPGEAFRVPGSSGPESSSGTTGGD
jgi:hypothetical protein